MKQKIFQIAQLVLIKMSSLFVMAFVLFFLLFKGNSESVGYFAGVTTIVAPLVMYCQYRYLEYLSLSDDKGKAFSVSLYASLLSFVILGLVLLLGASFFDVSLKLLGLMLLYKFFEQFADIYIAYLSVTKQMKQAFHAVAIRVGGVVILALIIYFLDFEQNIVLVEYMLWALLFVYGFAFIVNYLQARPAIRILESKAYIVEHYSYGFTSIFVSLNSLMPRYFFIMQGNYSALGIFSIIYLLASNFVNILQYPISLKSTQIKSILDRRNYVLYVGSIACFTMGALVVFVLDFTNYVSIVLGVLFMFMMLLIRGVYFTYSVANNLKHKVNFAVILSAIFATLVIIGLIYYFKTYGLSQAMFYVIFSAFITSSLLARHNKKVGV